TVAHAGDGNLHPLVLFDAKNPDEAVAAKKAGEEILDICIAMGGTITGEHGIGLEKLDAMPRMFDPADMAAMRKVKMTFDPDDVLNPGKMLPPDVGKPLPTKQEITQ
ncbi:MAG: FAD-binding oxidoreductase, partial [Dehalococcoidia bacterium]